MPIATISEQYDTTDVDQYSRQARTRIFLNPLFWVAFSTVGAAFSSLRFMLAGLAFQPYLVVLFLLLFRALPRIHRFPARIGRPGGLFLLLYILSLIQGTGFVIQFVKISIMALTFVIVALSVKSYDDFVAGAIGLGMCAAVLCVRGMVQGPGNFGSINPIDGSQKNAFSLFFLPALMLCLYLVFSTDQTLQRRLFLAFIITLIFAAILLSKNRSGWLTTAVLVLLVFSTNRRRLRVAFFIAIVGSLAFIVADVVISEAEYVYERDAINAARSDRLRMELIVQAVSLGFQHPLLGVSPTKLTKMLGAAQSVEDQGLDCHNLAGYLIGGSGVLTFGAFCLFAFAMLRPPRNVQFGRMDASVVRNARMLSTLTVVWLVRSQFQEDVLFSATFTAALGLCVGLCICSGVYDSHKHYDTEPEPDGT